MRLLERRFCVNVRLEQAWAHVAKVEQWPSWARHIRRIDLRPSGFVNADSQGMIYLTNGVRSTFRMEEFVAGTSWKWVGSFLWLKIHYDHQFSRIGSEQSEIRFVLDGEGFGVGLLGRLLAAVYARSLDRAIPRLIAELEHRQPR